MIQWLVILVLVLILFWISRPKKSPGSCPYAGTGSCQCGRNRGLGLLSRS